MKNKKLWFAAKRYGWGWYPVTWQGWAVTGLYTAIIVALSAFIGDGFNSRAGATTFSFLVFLLTLSLIWICYAKGEKPRWRWGNK